MEKVLTRTENDISLSIEEYEQIIYKWNDTDKACLYDKTTHEMFEEQVERTPDNIAIIYENTSLTYRELNEKANRLGNYLQKNYTIHPDTLIALCLDRSENMLIAIFAVLKAGGAFVPINPEYPDARIQYILEDTQTNLVLTNDLHKQRLEEINTLIANNLTGLASIQVSQPVEMLVLDNIALQAHLLLESKVNLEKTSTKSINLLYVIYTSGTTGKPKGVMIEHRSYVATIECMRDLYFSDKQPISTYNMTNYAFDMVGPEYGLPLFTGGTIVIGTNDFNALDCSNYDFIQITPTLCDLKLDLLMNTEDTKLLIGAESLSHDLLAKILNKSINVVHLYGPTETTIWSTSQYYSWKEDRHSFSVILGKPFDNEKVYVLDTNLSLLPIGTVGELYIGGIGLARGYLNKPGLTAERFISNPFQTMEEKAKNKNNRLYKTGDLVKWLPNGNLEYIGREDFQVKIRGYRIELGEIETVLSGYEGIKRSVVLAKDRLSSGGAPTGHKYLVGYYVATTPLDETKVSSYLQSRLPEYMIPNILIHLYALPQTINGKLDRKALPEPEFTNSDVYMAPRNTLETQLRDIWAEVLSLPKDKVGLRDDFFRSGGDSILAIRLVGKINKHLNVQLKARDIFELKCILNLAGVVASTHNDAQENTSYVPFCLVNMEEHKNIVPDISLIEDIYPASYLQVEMLQGSKLDKKGAYRLVSNYSVNARFDKNKLLSILKKLFNKHELLRAAFILGADNQWKVVVFKSVEIDCQIFSCESSRKLIELEKLNDYDCAKPSLFRVRVNVLDDNRFDLILSFHHAIEDGWSMASFINEFGHAYINNKPVEEILELRYGEFIQNELAEIKNKQSIDFWRQYLDGLNLTKASWKFVKETSEDGLYNTYLSLSAEQVVLIHKISRELKMSVDNIFLLAYLNILSDFTNNSDVTVGLVVNNRLEKEGGDKLFGLFLNIIPFRFDCNHQEDVSKDLLDIFNNKLELQKYKQLPYGYIKSLLKHELYDFVFNFVNLHILNQQVEGIQSIDGYERTHIPFSLTVVQKGDYAFILHICAQDSYISKDLLDYFTSCYEKCLVAMINSEYTEKF